MFVFSTQFFRHGDRTPLETYPNDPYNAVDIYWPEGLGQLTEQQYAIGQYLLSRYTRWVGSSNTSLVNISAACIPGVVCLLQVGREQQYVLGQHLRSRYSDLLPEVYSYKDLYVKSEDSDRCVMSAECNLFALYPPLYNTSSGNNIIFQPIPIHTVPASQDPVSAEHLLWDNTSSGKNIVFQPIPIHTVPTSQDPVSAEHLLWDNTSSGKNIVFQPIPIHTVPTSQDPVSAEHLLWDNHPFKSYTRDPYRWMRRLNIYNAWAICDMYLKGYELIKQSAVYKCIDNVTQNVRDAVKEYAGSTKFNAGIYDILLIEDLHNLTLPNWTAKYYPEPLQAINQFYWYLGVAGTKELQKVAIGSFLNEMVVNMVAKKNGTLSPDRKMFLYPGHDYTISDTFLALDIYDGVRAPYASFASIELRLKNNSHYVLITYSNSTTQEPYIMKLPNCDELCPFDTFLKIVQPMLVTDFSSECAKTPGSQEDWAIPIQNLPEEWKGCFASSTKTTPNQKPDKRI
uniref:acid phosphatase n=1 Tax=Timema bartmani TaxID=61472 RepID=A0A7R9ELL4_9NEOP|nr:unnamed protein product [Timema bartmani]